MAEEGTLCINGDVQKFAGADASSTSKAEAYTNVYIKMAEGKLCFDTRYDWVTNYASVSTIGKEVLRLATATAAAAMVMEYDLDGYTSRQNIMVMVNILWAFYQDIVNKITKDNMYKEFILSGSGDID